MVHSSVQADFRRRLFTAGSVGLIGVLGMTAVLVAAPAPAYAADVSSLAELRAAFANPTTVGGTARLTADVNGEAGALVLAPGGALSLDLHGHSLSNVHVALNAGTSLTITDTGVGGTLIAQGFSAYAAGIQTTGANLTIAGGTITATGGDYAAGIGGGAGNGGTVTIAGGTVTATGGHTGPGIGGSGSASGATTVTITGGVVNARAGAWAAGIGGGINSAGGVVAVSGGVVTATSGWYQSGMGAAPSAIGHGYDTYSTASSGTLRITNPGAVIIPEDSVLIVPVEMTVIGNGYLYGQGTVANSGAIQLPAENVLWERLGLEPNNHLVSFLDAGSPYESIRVFAPTLTAGARALPSDPTRAGATFTGWINAADGSGTVFNEDTTVPTDRKVWATWDPAPTTETTITSVPDSIGYGEPLPISAHVEVPGEPGIPIGAIAFYVDGQLTKSGTVDGFGNVSTSIEAIGAGPHSVTAEFIPADGRVFAASTSADAAVVVTPGETTTTATAEPPVQSWDGSVVIRGTVTALPPAPGTPTGAVRLVFVGDGAPTGEETLALQDGSYEYEAESWPPGTYSATAIYLGDTNFASSASDAAEFSIGRTETSVDVTLMQSRYGGTSATVTGAATISNTSTGADLDNIADGVTVYYRDAQTGRTGGGTELAVSDCTTGATVTCEFSGTVPEGDWLVWGEYDGSEHFVGGASDDEALTVRPYETQISVAPPVAATPYSQDIPLTVTLTSPDAPTGVVTEGYITVSVYDNSAGSGDAEWTSAEQTIPVASEATEFQVIVPGGVLHAGTWYAIATYHPSDGDAAFAGSTSAPGSLTVSALATTTTVTVDPPSTVFGAPVNGTATVTTSGATIPTGNVSVTVSNESGTVTAQQVTLGADGTVDFSFPADGEPPLDAGEYTVTANYLGTTDFTPSGPATTQFTVTPAPTTLAITESTQTVDFGQVIPLTFTIARSDAAGPPPNGGTVTYAIESMDPSSIDIPDSSTSVMVDDIISVTGPLLPGTYQVSATWAPPSGNFAAPTAAAATIIVNPAVPTVTIEPDVTDFKSGEPVSGTVTVTFGDPGASANVPPGSGTVTVDALNQAGETIGTATGTQQPDGTFAFTFPAGLFTVGPYTLTATFAPAEGAPFETPEPAEAEIGVGQQETTTTLTLLPMVALPGQSITAVAETTSIGGSTDGLAGGRIRLTDRTGTINLVGTISSPVSFQFAAPAPGVYYITATFEGSTEFIDSSSAEIELVVTAAPVAPPGGGEIARTGTDMMGPTVAGAGLIMLGLVFLLRRRRRTTQLVCHR